MSLQGPVTRRSLVPTHERVVGKGGVNSTVPVTPTTSKGGPLLRTRAVAYDYRFGKSGVATGSHPHKLCGLYQLTSPATLGADCNPRAPRRRNHCRDGGCFS